MTRKVIIAEGSNFSPKYKRATKWWITEYSGGVDKHGKEKYQLFLAKDLLPSETDYASFSFSWKVMRVFIQEMLKHYSKEEVEKELGIKIR